MSSSTDKVIKISLLAQSGNLSQVLNQANDAIKKLSQNATGSAGGIAAAPPTVAASYNRVTGSIKQLAAGFAIAQAGVFALTSALQSISGAGAGFIRVNDEMQQLRLQYQVLIGDAAKFKQLFAETKKFADSTPFTDVETYQAGKTLLSAQIKDVEEYKAALRGVGDLAAASGRPINEVAAAYARLKSGASGEAMEALRLMNISQTMFEAKGIRFDAGGQPLATSQKMVQTLNEIINSNFGGMTEKLSQSWSGLWSTFSSNAQNAAREVSGGAFSQLERALAGMNKAMDEALKDPDQKLKRFGDSIAGITGAVGGLSGAFGGLAGKGGSSAFQMITEGLAGINIAISTFSYLTAQGAAAMQFLWDVMSFSGNAQQNFVTNMQAATKAYQEQTDFARGALGLQKASALMAADAAEDAGNRTNKANTETAIKAVEANKATIAGIKTVLAAQEVLWAVEKAKGRDAVQLAQMEAEQRKVNLEALQNTESKLQASVEAQGKDYEKSVALLAAETEYAKSLEKYYDALIAKKETMGGFITNTSKLMAEAEGIDKRGGDSGVKRYEALKSAAEEYLDTLKKLRDNQNQTATGSEKMQAATDAAQSGNLSQYQNLSAAIDQNEKIFNIQALQERLQQIQQLSQAQNLGARERFSLYEQERQVFAEVTNGISGAIEDTMQKIESMQGKAMGAASSAMGILDKIGASSSAYSQVGNMIRSMNLDTGNMSLQNLGQMASIAEQLKKKGVRSSDLMPRSSEVLSALQKELSGVPESIGKLQTGLQSLIGLSTQIGAEAANNFWKPWETKLDQLKAQFGNLAMANLNPANSLMPPVQIPQGTAGGAGGKTVNVNAQTNLQVQGSTLKEVNDVVTKAKDRFGEELFAALQEANTLYGF